MNTSLKGPVSRKTPTALVLVIIFLVALLNYVDRSLLSILQEPIKQELSLSDTQLGALTGLSFALLYATLALPIARLADTGNRTRLLAACLFVWTLMTAFSGLATGFWVLVVCRMGVAIGEAGSGPTSHSLLADMVPRRWLATALGVMALAVPVGTTIGFLAGGWFTSVLGWRMTFIWIGLAGLLVVPLVLFLPEPPRRSAASAGPAPVTPWKETVVYLFSLGSFRWFLVGATCQAYVLYSVMNWIAPFYIRIHDWDIARVGVALAIMFGVGGAIGAFSGGRLVDVLSRNSPAWYGLVPAYAAMLAVPILSAQVFIGSGTVSAWLGIASILLLNVFIAPVNAAAQGCVTSRMRAMTSAIILAVPTIVGMGFGPLVTGMVSDLLSKGDSAGESVRLAIATPIALLFVSAAAFVLASKKIHRDLLPET